jgi:hypothetical protein
MSKVDYSLSLANLKIANAAIQHLAPASLRQLESLLTEGTVSRADIVEAKQIIAPLLDPNAYNFSFRAQNEPALLGIDTANLSADQTKAVSKYAYAVSRLSHDLYSRGVELDEPAKIARQTARAIGIFGTGSAVSIAALLINPVLGGAVLGVGGLSALIGLGTNSEPFGN